MDAIEQRALYALMRMNWLNDPSLPVEPWQVEDYRDLPLHALFERLKPLDIHLDRTSYIAYADECDSPEELTEHLLGDRQIGAVGEDQIYLLIFELWRRLISEKPSLSILCHELDHQIFLYDRDELDNPLALQDALNHFVHILDENVDQGILPEEALKLISHYFANDFETFLYDFIAEQIDEGNEAYAHELLDDFGPYLGNNKWFKLLRIQLCAPTHSKKIQAMLEEIVEEHLNDQDLDYNLELLSLAAQRGERDFFLLVMKHTLPLIGQEEALQDLLAIAMDYFQRLDQGSEEIALKNRLNKRSAYPLDASVDAKDPDLAALAQLFNLKEENPS